MTRREINYLEGASFVAHALRMLRRDAKWLSATEAVLELPPSKAEEFREAFTEELARVGFDEDYAPTPEGQLLENLIDRFHSC